MEDLIAVSPSSALKEEGPRPKGKTLPLLWNVAGLVSGVRGPLLFLVANRGGPNGKYLAPSRWESNLGSLPGHPRLRSLI